ncbi:putative nuclease HARBI1 [Plodia interpunctella]|uniref:putative nuclease HARBI1 n=1 Tax=Plodia interpunctella TaxID=58824 RepID=UPI002367D733|nr:putative nuclease HARBI1 [Plodia interpunctella]
MDLQQYSLTRPLSSLESESDSDEEFFDTILKWYIKYEGGEGEPGSDTVQRPSVKFTKDIYLQSLNDSEFTLRFMLSKTAVDSLLPKMIQYFANTKTSSNNRVSPLHQLLLTLRFYVQGSIPEIDFLNISKPSASRIIQDISGAIASLSKDYLFVREGNTDKFKKIADFPNVLGIINCTTISLHMPSPGKCKQSEANLELFVQAICDADLRFINIKVHWPGVALQSITSKFAMKENYVTNQYLLGDSKYSCKKNLLTPVVNPSTEAHKRYNEAHLKTWKTIEKTFALWKQRFTVVARPMCETLWNIHRIITATAVLHNICMDNNLEEITSNENINNNVEYEMMNCDEDDASKDDDTERISVINHFGDVI